MQSLGNLIGRVLLCPSCGSNCLHHKTVEIFEREEDDEQGLHVLVANGAIAIDEKMKGCPSHRRHGLRVWFHCEMCPAESSWIISQEKGQTFIGWESIPVYDVDADPADQRARLYDAANEGFCTSSSCGPAGEYQFKAEFRSLERLQEFYAAFIDMMAAERDARAK